MLRVGLTTAGLLTCSNIFMTFAWYAHLRNLRERTWYVAAIVSWSIALVEYLLQVPANRIGYTAFDLGQLKILQEVITLSVFVPFAVLYMKQRSNSITSGQGAASWAPSTSCSARESWPNILHCCGRSTWAAGR
ncbi:MAG TPA: DMT family protein [Vicinamibacterales bacterium]|nr:DMT family protein [Vicinamibacterales bacterium]